MTRVVDHSRYVNHVRLADAASEANAHSAAGYHYAQACKEAVDNHAFIDAAQHLKWAEVHQRKAVDAARKGNTATHEVDQNGACSCMPEYQE